MVKTYHEINPRDSLLFVDSAASIGGVWAQERLYSGLKTNNVVGTYEFSDYPMEIDRCGRYGCKEGDHIPGEAVHRYLCDAAEHFNIHQFFRPRCKVQRVVLQDDYSWIVHMIQRTDTGRQEEIHVDARRLVLATGTTSEPYTPAFIGQDQFKRPILHSKQLRAEATLLSSAKRVTVLGGNKSAFDVCYSAAQAGAQVQLVIRSTGGGPSYVWPGKFRWLGHITSIAKISRTRLFACFDPCIWAGADGSGWLRGLLHRTWLGRKTTSLFWHFLTRSIHRVNGYDSHIATAPLKPWTNTFWMGNSLSTHNYEHNWFDLVTQGKIRVHIAEVVKLDEDMVHLSTGDALDTDVLVCCTGWKAAPPISFEPTSLPESLGLPGPRSVAPEMFVRARTNIVTQSPDLQQLPERNITGSTKSREHLPSIKVNIEKSADEHPYQLYRFMVPADDRFLRHRTLAVLGAHLSLHAVAVAQAQALWITAYFLDQVPTIQVGAIDNVMKQRIQQQTILETEFQRIRHPPSAGGSGERYPDLVFESIPYIDMLLQDLGLRVKRKQSWFQEWLTSYEIHDYRGLVEEWKLRWESF